MKIKPNKLHETWKYGQRLPNGSFAIVDKNNKMVAYKKDGNTDDGGVSVEWDWVRKDFQKQG